MSVEQANKLSVEQANKSPDDRASELSKAVDRGESELREAELDKVSGGKWGSVVGT